MTSPAASASLLPTSENRLRSWSWKGIELRVWIPFDRVEEEFSVELNFKEMGKLRGEREDVKMVLLFKDGSEEGFDERGRRRVEWFRERK